MVLSIGFFSFSVCLCFLKGVNIYLYEEEFGYGLVLFLYLVGYCFYGGFLIFIFIVIYY